jgi:hypothetical protein
MAEITINIPFPSEDELDLFLRANGVVNVVNKTELATELFLQVAENLMTKRKEQDAMEIARTAVIPVKLSGLSNNNPVKVVNS